MPISLIELINIRDRIILVMTLKIEIYKGVFVFSLAKKQIIKTLINTYKLEDQVQNIDKYIRSIKSVFLSKGTSFKKDMNNW